MVNGVVDIIENKVALILSGKEGTTRHYIPATALQKRIKEGDRVKITAEKLFSLEKKLKLGPVRGQMDKTVIFDEPTTREYAIQLNENLSIIKEKKLSIKDIFPAKRGMGQSTSRRPIKIYFLNVGQGDSIYIKFPNNRNMLIDSADTIQNNETSTYDFLKSKKIRELDAFILTHPHIDHIEGALKIIKDKDIKLRSMFCPEYAHNSDYYNNVMISMIAKANKKVNIGCLNSESAKFIFGDCRFTILSPAPDVSRKSVKKVNNSSIVIKLQLKINNKAFGILFAGDLELDHWDKLISKYGSDLKSNILKVSHHGSKTGTNSKVMDVIQPDEVIISVGKNNMFGHPHKDVITLLQKTGKKVYRTDKNGTIELLLGTNSYKINHQYN